MIGNVIRGNGARGLLDYVAGKSEATLLSTNLTGETPREFAAQFGDVRALYPRDHVRKPVVHLPLRPAPGEDLTDDQWREVTELCLARLGYENSPYVAYLHEHEDGRHLHIATYRCDFNGRLVGDSKDRYKMADFTEEISRRFGLTHAPLREDGRSLTRPELERLLANPDRAAAKDGLRRALDEAAARHSTVRGFLSELHNKGVRLDLKIARNTGQVQGISFMLPDGSRIKGSDLGKGYSFAALLSRHDLRDDLKPETPFLQVRGVSAAEHRALCREGLAPDSVQPQGKRLLLGWQLPPQQEHPFADLIANRLPHRFLAFPDSLPVAPASTQALVERSEIVRVARALRQSPEAAPAYQPFAIPPAAKLLASHPDLTAKLAELDTISRAIVHSSETRAHGSSPALRQRYHELLFKTLASVGGFHESQGISGPLADLRDLAAFRDRPADQLLTPLPPRPAEPDESYVWAEESPNRFPDDRAFMRNATESLESLRAGAVPRDSLKGSYYSLAAYLADPILENYHRLLKDQHSLRPDHQERADHLAALTAASLRKAETAFFERPSETTATAWVNACRAHSYYAVSVEATDWRQLEREHNNLRRSESRHNRLPDATSQWARIFEAEILGRGRLADRLALALARKAWSKTPMARAASRVLHPVRAALRAVPGGGVLLATVDVANATTRTLRRSHAIYLEVRAAQDAHRRISAAARTLAQGDFSNAALAAALRGHPPAAIAAGQRPASIQEAIRQSRSAEARLLVAYRSHGRGRLAPSALRAAAGQALEARAAVTASLVEALGAPPLSRFTAVLGARDGRALSAFVGSLQNVGLSARAITSAVIEAAPMIGPQLALALAVGATQRAVRFAVRFLMSHAQQQFRQILEAQNERRQ